MTKTDLSAVYQILQYVIHHIWYDFKHVDKQCCQGNVEMAPFNCYLGIGEIIGAEQMFTF